jgi:hypothetical protein
MKGCDFVEVRSWFAERKLEVGRLPQIGYRTDTAAVFLMQSDSDVAFIEPVVTKPTARGKKLHFELMVLVDRCTEEAKKLGYNKVIGHTNFRGLTRIGNRLGFRADFQYVLEKTF